ncbi:Nucleolar protein 16 [Coemansia brasiliensis]|uniref:Nucleolar protein 16 n=1 Tax=Coemansia brasiliensis TaxID=2650707 RepID=A0A9W8IE27_9FUNG|nr:Nucleolar protein 16 [Coemansia brasiliensis]
MVRPIARKKLRNPALKTTRRRAEKNRKKKFTGHPLLRELWDDSLTVTENYRKLGLVSKLNGVSGGTVKEVTHQSQEEEEKEEKEEDIKKSIPQGYGLIERDDDGNIVNVILPDEPQDPLDSDYEPEPVKAKKEGAQILERFSQEYETRKNRWMSQGERRILQKFIDKHGENYKAMFWDQELNKQQLTERQLQKKIEKYLKEKQEFEQ